MVQSSLQETSVPSSAASQGQGFDTIKMIIEKLCLYRAIVQDQRISFLLFFLVDE